MTDYKALAQEMLDSLAGGDVDATVDKYIAQDFVEHEDVPGMGKTRETPRQLFKTLQAAITDFRFDVHDVLQDGDKVVIRGSMVGQHTGEFMGVPASGRPISIDAIDILQFRDDQCVAHWGVMDMGAALAQMSGS